jgi:3-phenylpropionate/cinnamic acid dioxygenase small subunit
VEEDDDGMTIDLAETITVTTTENRAPSFDEAIAFIWTEADMLDRLDYKPWLKLWTEKGEYIIPVERDAPDYADALNIVLDNQEMRESRAKRLLSGFSMSSAPPARTVRTVSRFVILAQDETSITLRGAQMLAEYKYQHMRFLPADMLYRIVRRPDGRLLIDRKIVTLINAEDFQFGIGYLL